MENAGYFKTPQQMLFSRRIVDPQFASALLGGWGVGLSDCSASTTERQASGSIWQAR